MGAGATCHSLSDRASDDGEPTHYCPFLAHFVEMQSSKKQPILLSTNLTIVNSNHDCELIIFINHSTHLLIIFIKSTS